MVRRLRVIHFQRGSGMFGRSSTASPDGYARGVDGDAIRARGDLLYFLIYINIYIFYYKNR